MRRKWQSYQNVSRETLWYDCREPKIRRAARQKYETLQKSGFLTSLPLTFTLFLEALLDVMRARRFKDEEDT